MHPVNGRGPWRTIVSKTGVRALGDTLILSPPLVINEEQIGQIADSIKNGIRTL
jgi:adenosylmethionine-8-amino-7-oxononanoate aminotransferase